VYPSAVRVRESISCARIVSIGRRSTVARIRDPSAPEQRAWLSQHLDGQQPAKEQSLPAAEDQVPPEE
jgi:hypothetical protein